jgi:hypothetical protein
MVTGQGGAPPATTGGEAGGGAGGGGGDAGAGGGGGGAFDGLPPCEDVSLGRLDALLPEEPTPLVQSDEALARLRVRHAGRYLVAVTRDDEAFVVGDGTFVPAQGAADAAPLDLAPFVGAARDAGRIRLLSPVKDQELTSAFADVAELVDAVVASPDERRVRFLWRSSNALVDWAWDVGDHPFDLGEGTTRALPCEPTQTLAASFIEHGHGDVVGVCGDGSIASWRGDQLVASPGFELHDVARVAAARRDDALVMPMGGEGLVDFVVTSGAFGVYLLVAHHAPGASTWSTAPVQLGLPPPGEPSRVTVALDGGGALVAWTRGGDEPVAALARCDEDGACCELPLAGAIAEALPGSSPLEWAVASAADGGSAALAVTSVGDRTYDLSAFALETSAVSPVSP